MADYIARRDGGVTADYSNVFLTNGASDAIKVGIQWRSKALGWGALVQR